MIPTVAQVLTRARSVGLLDDIDADVFTDTVLAEPFAAAYGRLMEEMLNYGLPRIRKEAFYNLAAYTMVLFPATAGISDFGELVDDGLEERDYLTTASITAASGSLPITVTATGHGRSTGDRIQIHGMVGETGGNGEWLVTVSGNDLALNGAVSEGTWTSGGTVTYGTDRWRTIEETELSRLVLPTVDINLRYFEWRGDAFRFIGSNTARQLRITYLSSGTAPTSGSVGVDGSLDFLATYTAAAAGAGRDRQDATRLYALALGSREDPGGLLHRLVNPMVKAQQRVNRQPQGYSPQNWRGGVRRKAPYFQV